MGIYLNKEIKKTLNKVSLIKNRTLIKILWSYSRKLNQLRVFCLYYGLWSDGLIIGMIILKIRSRDLEGFVGFRHVRNEDEAINVTERRENYNV